MMYARLTQAVSGPLLCVLLGTLAAAAAPPANFQNELVLGNLTGPTGLTFLPDGRMLVLEKSGQMLIVDPQAEPVASSVYMTIADIESGGERGLLDVTLDPDFANNSWFYVYYTNASTARNRIARFDHLGDTGDLGSEVLIWEDNENWSSCCHYGGGLDFGPDGKLYLTTGEEFDGVQAQTLSRAGGKIHRLNKDGSVPSDNPFVGVPGALPTIWAYGLRNPFRARFDLPTGRLFIGEVGGNSSASWEDIHLGAAGANYGWPNCEGVCVDPAYSDPIYTYSHVGGGASVTGGVVYRGGSFPPEYVGGYFYADYVRGWLRYLTLDPNGAVASSNEFDPTVGPIVGIEQGPDGALYVLILQASGLNIISGEVRRFVYDDGNAAPTILSATATPASGQAPLLVSFDATGDDQDGDPLIYRWDLGDGTEAFGSSVQHTYTSNGLYQARVEVSDGTRRTTSNPLTIEVGNPPTASIDLPLDGTVFRFGDVISYAGQAIDPDETLDPNRFSWVVRFVRPESFHPALGPVSGTAGSFPIPVQGQGFSGPVRYEFILTVTDSDGLVDTDSVFIYPDKVDLTFETNPPGIPVVVDGNAAREAPFTLDTLIHFEHIITVPTSACIDGTLHTFAHWSDGGAPSHVITVPDTDTTYTATYLPDGDCACNRSLAFDGSNDVVTLDPISLSGDFTVEAWVRLAPGISNDDGILFNSGGTQDINFFGGRARLYSTLGSGAGGGGNPNDRIIASSTTSANTWTHVAITRMGTDLTLYLDGVQDATGSWDGTLTFDRLGRAVSGHTEGELDEIRIWNVHRSAAEISAGWRDVVNPATPGLLAYWSADEEVTDPQLLDRSLNGNDGWFGASLQPGTDDPVRVDPGAPLLSGALCPTPRVLLLTAPTQDAPVLSRNVEVRWQLSGSVAADDRVQLTLNGGDNGQGDGSVILVDPNQPFTLLDVPYGMNTVEAVLATAAGIPYGNTEAFDAIVFFVAQAPCDTQALLFDGGDDRVSYPEFVLTDDFTVEAWLRLDATITNADVPFANGLGSQNINFFQERIRIFSTSGTGSAGGPNANDRIIANTSAQPDVWTHYAVTRASGTVALYINGALDATSDWSGDFTIRASGPFGGQMDEIRIWDVARSEQQIAESYALPLSSSQPGLLAYYRLEDDPNAQVLLDASPAMTNAVRGSSGAPEPSDPLFVPAQRTALADVDADGILDGCDACPQTQPGTPVDPFGCPLPPGDCDGDGLLRIEDLAAFADCHLGPGTPRASDCGCADLTDDGSVDLHDFLLLQRGIE